MFRCQTQKIKNIFTLVLKGHIAVATSDLKKNNTGKKLDIHARKFLKNITLIMVMELDMSWIFLKCS